MSINQDYQGQPDLKSRKYIVSPGLIILFCLGEVSVGMSIDKAGGNSCLFTFLGCKQTATLLYHIITNDIKRAMVATIILYTL